MFNQFLQNLLAPSMQSVSLLILAINVVVHILFAAAVAKDGGHFIKTGQTTILVSPVTWGFATLVGGVFVAAIYWVLHHLPLLRTK